MRRPILAIAWLLSSVVTAAQAAPTVSMLYVVRRGWHLDVGFAVPDLAPPLASLAGEFVGAKFLFFGFGDRRYLLAKRHDGPELLQALWPGAGVILVTAISAAPTDAFKADQVVALQVSPRQLREAQQFLWGSLAARRLPGPPPAILGPYPGSLYFSATPRYSGFHTCNTWVAELLRAAALPIRSNGVIFAGQLWRQVARLAKQPLRSYDSSLTYRQGGLVPSWQTTVVVDP
jgi:hypothetical protein